MYSVDTIIKDVLRLLLAKLQERDGLDGVTEPCYEKLKDNLKNKDNKFVLKLLYYEEYMFGDYPICTYDSIRTLVREYETVNLTLMMFKREDAHPNTSKFPPIVYMPKGIKFEYKDLLKKYMDLFPVNAIMFRCFPDDSMHEFYFKEKNKRRKQLTKYTESGDCDFPLVVNIKGLKNLFSLKKTLDEKKYHEDDIDLPFFEILESMESVKKKQTFFQKLTTRITDLFLCKKKNKEEEKELKEKLHEEQEHKKAIAVIGKKYKKNIEILNDHNHLKHKFKKKEDEAEKMTGVMGGLRYSSNSNYTAEKIKKLTNEPSQDKNHNHLVLEDTSEKFLLSNYVLPFLPGFLRIEVIIMYGCYEITKTSTRFFIINNDVNMNEKINFSDLFVNIFFILILSINH